MKREDLQEINRNQVHASINEYNRLISGNLLIGNRIPHEYFITRGSGQSDITIHAGSFHLALKDAGIEKANIITYSSILPGTASEIRKPAEMTHGAVVESIMAVSHGEKGEELSAGIAMNWLYNRNTGEKFGGIVCEHSGKYDEVKLQNLLKASLEELYQNGFSEKYSRSEPKLITNSCCVNKKYGTVLVSLCFTNYIYPVLNIFQK